MKTPILNYWKIHWARKRLRSLY